MTQGLKEKVRETTTWKKVTTGNHLQAEETPGILDPVGNQPRT